MQLGHLGVEMAQLTLSDRRRYVGVASRRVDIEWRRVHYGTMDEIGSKKYEVLRSMNWNIKVLCEWG